MAADAQGGSATPPAATRPRAPPAPVSRAGSTVQVTEVATEIVRKLVEVASLSRATFARDVARIVKESVPDLVLACA